MVALRINPSRRARGKLLPSPEPPKPQDQRESSSSESPTEETPEPSSPKAPTAKRPRHCTAIESISSDDCSSSNSLEDWADEADPANGSAPQAQAQCQAPSDPSRLLCAVCNASGAEPCPVCKSTAYCTPDHAIFDSVVHKFICAAFAALPPIEERYEDRKLAIFFRHDSRTPVLRFEPVPNAEDKPKHYTELKSVHLDLTRKNDKGRTVITFPLDHVLRITESAVLGAGGAIRNKDKVGANKSIKACTATDVFNGCTMWKGSVLAVSFRKRGDEVRWLDCTAADFRHLLVWFWRWQEWCAGSTRRMFPPKIEGPPYPWAEEEKDKGKGEKDKVEGEKDKVEGEMIAKVKAEMAKVKAQMAKVEGEMAKRKSKAKGAGKRKRR